jgi:hypothetical protein
MRPETAAGLTRAWSRIYTMGLSRAERIRRRAELESDLWESLADPQASQQILSRLMRGAIDDIAWSAGQMNRAARGSLLWTVGSLLVFSTVALWLAYAPDGRLMRESMWGWPLALVLHNLGFVALIALRIAVDLRLTSGIFGAVPVSELVRKLMPATVLAALIVIASGLALFTPDPGRTLANEMGQVKLVLLVVALLNAWFLHAVTFRTIEQWDTAEVVPVAARVSGIASMTLWASIIVTSMLAPFLE